MRSPVKVSFILLFSVITFTITPSTAKTTLDTVKKAIEAMEANVGQKLDRIIALLTKPSQGSTFASCREIYNKQRLGGNGAYLLQMPRYGKIPVYCHMTSHGLGECGGGGWTLVMKIDGHKRNFHYNSNLWSNKVDYNLPGGKTLLDNHQTKLPTYWNTPFSKICLGMKIGHHRKYVIINKPANSMHSLIADGRHRAISLGRKTWKTLIGSQASLQPKCNREGFNCFCHDRTTSKARIGILADLDTSDSCDRCDSRIGFGTGGLHDDSNTCGNEATYGGDNGDKHIRAMGYILVQ